MRASVEPKHERLVGDDFGVVLDKIGKEEFLWRARSALANKTN